MKMMYKFNVAFLSVVIFLAPMINMVSAGCHSHSHANLSSSHDAGNTKHSTSAVTTSTDSHHCHSNTTPEKENSEQHRCCNNHTLNTGFLSSTTFQVTLLSNFFRPPEKNSPALEVYSTPYIPPRNA